MRVVLTNHSESDLSPWKWPKNGTIGTTQIVYAAHRISCRLLWSWATKAMSSLLQGASTSVIYIEMDGSGWPFGFLSNSSLPQGSYIPALANSVNSNMWPSTFPDLSLPWAITSGFCPEGDQLTQRVVEMQCEWQAPDRGIQTLPRVSSRTNPVFIE